LALRGVGPFRGEALQWTSDPPDGLLVRVQVANQGTQGGRAKCQLRALDASERVLRDWPAVSPEVPGGSTITFEERIAGIPAAPVSVTVRCR
ncbi:MAG: hypothetical protein M3P32_09355, partial [Chloroflexota bacterium]|nr:hypothetical protein [Chloroflexota bacterium]